MRPFTFTYLGSTYSGTVRTEGDYQIATIQGPHTEHTAKDRFAFAAIGKAIAAVQGITLTDNAAAN